MQLFVVGGQLLVVGGQLLVVSGFVVAGLDEKVLSTMNWKFGKLMAMKSNFEKLRVYRLSEKMSDQVWNLVADWDWFEKRTVGLQLVRAAICGANIAEGEDAAAMWITSGSCEWRAVRLTRQSIFCDELIAANFSKFRRWRRSNRCSMNWAPR
jgi:hypothetical protein